MPHISVAPMMDYTDKHARYFLRLLNPHVLLYTEMITSHAIIHGDVKRLLDFDPAEKYVALQLGGSDPKDLAYCAHLGESWGYDEINLNVGCPSPRVSSGQFGACLMLAPDLVADCFASMSAKVNIPVTIKCRIGVDDCDEYDYLYRFIEKIASVGCKTFILHARKALLKGLSPKENREIPPLKYPVVQQIKRDFPQLQIIINGGVKTIADIEFHLQTVDGVMIGREAYFNPYLLAEIHAHFFGGSKISREAVLKQFLPYIENQLKKGVNLVSITRHILGLFHGQKGARAWRRQLSTYRGNASAEQLETLLLGYPTALPFSSS